MITEISYDNILKIRHEVMYPYENLDFVKLKDDDKGIHIGYLVEGQPVSVFSLFLENNILQFRKFATLEAFQNKGYGTKLLEWLISYAQEMQFESIWCNARSEKTDFYKKFGFEETDETFEKDGFKFIVLEKKLREA